MASDVSPKHMANGQSAGQGPLGQSLTNSTSMSLPGVDQEKLKARLYSYAPHQATLNTRALKFNRLTNAQNRKASVQKAARMEPLVS